MYQAVSARNYKLILPHMKTFYVTAGEDFRGECNASLLINCLDLLFDIPKECSSSLCFYPH